MKELNTNELLTKQISDIYGKNFKISDFDEKIQSLLSNINTSYQKFEYQVEQNNILFEEEENIVFTIGLNAGVLRANKKFYQTFGFKNLQDFKSQYECVCELFIEEDGYLRETSNKAHWTKPILDNPNERHKVKIRDYQGGKRVYSVSLKEVSLLGNQFKICTFSDITELEETIEDLKRSEEAKSIFMANMSHEIRTPMNPIIGFTKLLLESEMTTQQKEFLEIIEASAESLNSLVNDILDFSKIEKRKLELEIREVNIFTDFYATFSSFRSEFKDKKIAYHINIDPNISESLMLDQLLVAQVLTNLISNAIKFTPQYGEVKIEIKKIESTQRDERILFSVQDTGIGIESEEIDAIFKSFTQVDASLNKAFQGAGLGLSISKAICEQMDSALMVQSLVGEGSTFSFQLLLEKSQQPKKLSDKRKGKPIYLIKDSQPNYQYTLKQLEDFKIPYQAISLEELKSHALNNEIVILFDYKLAMRLNLKSTKVLLIDENSEARLLAKSVHNLYLIDSLLVCPSEIYRAISIFNDLLHAQKSDYISKPIKGDDIYNILHKYS